HTRFSRDWSSDVCSSDLKEALLDAMGDALVAQIDLPEPSGEWPAQLRDLILAARATMLRHPWSARVLDSRDQAGPATVAYIDRRSEERRVGQAWGERGTA